MALEPHSKIELGKYECLIPKDEKVEADLLIHVKSEPVDESMELGNRESPDGGGTCPDTITIHLMSDPEDGSDTRKAVRELPPGRKLSNLDQIDKNRLVLLSTKARNSNKSLFEDIDFSGVDSSDFEDSGSEVIPRKSLTKALQELEYLKEKYSIVNKKYKASIIDLAYTKEKLEKTRRKKEMYKQLNIKLQTEVIEKVVSMNGTSLVQQDSSANVQESLKSVDQGAPNETSASKGSESLFEINCDQPSESLESVDTPHDTPKKTPSKPEPIRDFRLSSDEISSAKRNTKPGAAGDSQFVKNLAAAIWPANVLCQKSVSGKRSNRFKNMTAKPQLTPHKLDHLRATFMNRLKEENPDISEAEILIRSKNIPMYISQKIATLNRAMVVSPTADN